MTVKLIKAARVHFPGGKRVDAAVGDHVIRTDQSQEHGGEGSAPEPFDLFLGSLATCAGVYVLGFCQARGISTDGLWLSQDSSFEDGKLREVRLAVHVPETFPEKYLGAIRVAAGSCRVKKALAEPPQITVDVEREPIGEGSPVADHRL
ncbi:MAG TPA: OsmC family protein [Polyangiaceae bacterium]|jgi:ribosomal protein S12 methylthiotransferase accessory factor|nr:OsmC family protein [Polyangiaceae bacterium]